MATVVPLSDEDPVLVVVRFTAELAWADGGAEVLRIVMLSLWISFVLCSCHSLIMSVYHFSRLALPVRLHLQVNQVLDLVYSLNPSVLRLSYQRNSAA